MKSSKQNISSDTAYEDGDADASETSRQHVLPGEFFLKSQVLFYLFTDWCIPVTVLSFHIACMVVFILGSLCYLTSLNGAFVFDDAEAIVNNEDVKGNTALTQVFFNDFWGTSLTHKSSHKSYRPLTILSFR